MNRREFFRLFAATPALGFFGPTSKSGPVGFLQTRFPELDRALSGGLKPTSLYLLASLPAVGKTSFAINITKNTLENGHRVAFYGDSWELQRHNLPQHASVSLLDQASVAELCDDARRRFSGEGLDLVIIDHVQLLDRETATSQQTIEVLHDLARELNVPILALSQLRDGKDENHGLLSRGPADAIIILRRPVNSAGVMRPYADATVRIRTGEDAMFSLPANATRPPA